MGPGRRNTDQRAVAITPSWLRVFVLSALLVLAGSLLSGCGAAADDAVAAKDAGPPKRGGTITIGEEQEPQCLNMKIACGGMAVADDMYTPMYDALLTVDAEEQYAPLLATRIPTTQNGDVVENEDGSMDVTMRLKPTARWSDKRPITCEDLVFTWKTMMDERWTIISRTGWDLISEVECLDQRTAVYHFTERYALFLNIVGGAPLPKHSVQGKDFNSYLNERQPVTSGPFKFGYWTRSVEIVLKRNENYWNAGPNDLPYADELRFVFLPSAETSKIQVRTGEVDVIFPPPDSTLKDELENMPRIGFQLAPDTTRELVHFNSRKWPTSEEAVRQAISYSIDRKQITDTVLKGQAKELNSPLLPQNEGYYIASFEKYHLDNAKARKILEADGWKKGGTYYEKNGKPLVITLKSTAGNDLRQKVGQLMQQSLAKSGIRAELEFVNSSVFFSQTTIQGNFNMAIWGTTSGLVPDLRTMFACDMIPTRANKYSGNNNDNWCDERATELLKKGAVEPDVPTRQKHYREVQQILGDQAAILPLFQRPGAIAYGDKIRGIDINPLAGRTWNAQSWWRSDS